MFTRLSCRLCYKHAHLLPFPVLIFMNIRLLLIAFLSCLAVSASASAAEQPAGTITLELRDPALGVCNANVYDPRGYVTEDAAAGNLTGHDVVLESLPGQADSCKVGLVPEPTDEDYDVDLQLASSASGGALGAVVVNQDFYVRYHVGNDASVCMRGGSFAGKLDGWVLGSYACGNGASACTPGWSAYQKVTPRAAGNFSFSILCSNATGPKSLAPVAVTQPAAPANIELQGIPSSAQPGTSFNVSWAAVAGASKCDGTGTINSTPATLGPWTTATTVTSPRKVNVPASAVAGQQLRLTLECKDAAGVVLASGTAGPISIGAATACPATIASPNPAQANRTLSLIARSDVTYGVYAGTRTNVNLLEWNDVWGHASHTDSGTSWPGPIGSNPVIKGFQRNSYMGVHFKTSATGLVPGSFTNQNYVGSANLVMAISSVCGDFTEHLPSPGCLKESQYGGGPWSGTPASDTKMVSYKFTDTNPTGYCNLQPSTDYYVNIYMADPNQVVSGKCPQGSPTCPISAQRR